MKAKSEGTAKRSEKVSAGSKKATAKKEVKKVVKETAAPSEAEIRKKSRRDLQGKGCQKYSRYTGKRLAESGKAPQGSEIILIR